MMASPLARARPSTALALAFVGSAVWLGFELARHLGLGYRAEDAGFRDWAFPKRGVPQLLNLKP